MTGFWALIIVANLFTAVGLVTQAVWPCLLALVFVSVAVLQLVMVGVA